MEESTSKLRKRVIGGDGKSAQGKDGEETCHTQNTATEQKPTAENESEDQNKMQSGTYWLTRIVFTRSLGLVYFVAFLVALNQNKQLIGANGLLPIPVFFSRLRHILELPTNSTVTLDALKYVPTFFWWVPDEHVDIVLDVVAYVGIALSCILMFQGSGNIFIFIILRVFYHSLVYVGQVWYAFGWETQLLEMGFLAIFMVPLFSLRQFPRHTHTSWTVVWGNRWLLFRIMIGAGLIKIRGDQCWSDLTCMNYHYETQPVPSPLSYYLHQTPELVHKAETLGNHFVELIVPFFIILPRPFRLACGVIQILFQVALIFSGNLSFLNWLTIVPVIFCFDDLSLRWMFSSKSQQTVVDLQKEDRVGVQRPLGYYIRRVSSVGMALLLAYLSIPVAQNLLSSGQVMNTSFDSLRIVNTYGAFGSITKERTEVILEGTFSTDPMNPETVWEEIEFKCKPGRTDRRPCVITPYHYRLDWLMWFAAFQKFQENPWLVHLCAKVIAGDPSVNSLIESNPFEERRPEYVRVQHYSYEFTKLGSEEAMQGHWWQRKLIGEYIPIISATKLQSIAKQQGWKWYKETKKK